MNRGLRLGTVLAVLLSAASCSPGPTQPTSSPASAPKNLEHFEELVGTNWVGTARFTSSDGSVTTQPTSMAFLWRSVCDIPGWCAQGYSPFGSGTIDGLRLVVMGYPPFSVEGAYRRDIQVGDQPRLGSGRWQTAQLSADQRRLVISSTDFSWDQRRGVTFDLSRAPWPADINCPPLRTCQP